MQLVPRRNMRLGCLNVNDNDNDCPALSALSVLLLSPSPPLHLPPPLQRQRMPFFISVGGSAHFDQLQLADPSPSFS